MAFQDVLWLSLKSAVTLILKALPTLKEVLKSYSVSAQEVLKSHTTWALGFNYQIIIKKRYYFPRHMWYKYIESCIYVEEIPFFQQTNRDKLFIKLFCVFSRSVWSSKFLHTVTMRVFLCFHLQRTFAFVPTKHLKISRSAMTDA